MAMTIYVLRWAIGLLMLASYAGASSIGVCYGRDADNLPSPYKVAQLLQAETIYKVRLFNPDIDVLKAFTNTQIQIIVGIPNSDIPYLSENLDNAKSWVDTYIIPFVPGANIVAIAVGSEVITSTPTYATLLLPAMKNLYYALCKSKITRQIKVSSPHAMGVLHTSYPPSAGCFDPAYIKSVFKPLLDFLHKSCSPFMINAYPYYAYRNDISYLSIDYALFRRNKGLTDSGSGFHYDNLFVAQIDAIYYAMAALGYNDINVVVSETGWPSMGDPGETDIVNWENAATYTENLVYNLLNNSGTPLKPGQLIDTYIFELFNEDMRPGPTSNRNWGLFNTDGSPFYNITFGGGHGSAEIIQINRTFCVAAPGVTFATLQRNLDWVCSVGLVDCSPIQPGGRCYQPDTVTSHASYAFNAYYQQNGQDPNSCTFKGAAMQTIQDPSYDNCIYKGSILSTDGAESGQLCSPFKIFVTFILALMALL